jgi:hypothetical protein
MNDRLFKVGHMKEMVEKAQLEANARNADGSTPLLTGGSTLTRRGAIRILNFENASTICLPPTSERADSCTSSLDPYPPESADAAQKRSPNNPAVFTSIFGPPESLAQPMYPGERQVVVTGYYRGDNDVSRRDTEDYYRGDSESSRRYYKAASEEQRLLMMGIFREIQMPGAHTTTESPANASRATVRVTKKSPCRFVRKVRQLLGMRVMLVVRHHHTGSPERSALDGLDHGSGMGNSTCTT